MLAYFEALLGVLCSTLRSATLPVKAKVRERICTWVEGSFRSDLRVTSGTGQVRLYMWSQFLSRHARRLVTEGVSQLLAVQMRPEQTRNWYCCICRTLTSFLSCAAAKHAI